MEEFQEQIPHMQPSPYTELKARSDIISKRQQRSHVHGEMQRREAEERRKKFQMTQEEKKVHYTIQSAYASIYEKNDHEVSMIRSELKTAMDAINRLQDKMKGGERDVEAWVQSKITKAADYLSAAANYIDSGESNVK